MPGNNNFMIMYNTWNTSSPNYSWKTNLNYADIEKTLPHSDISVTGRIISSVNLLADWYLSCNWLFRELWNKNTV